VACTPQQWLARGVNTRAMVRVMSIETTRTQVDSYDTARHVVMAKNLNL
jgi:hypothetical protein